MGDKLRGGTTIGGNIAYHAGNMGAGSSLDSDLLDGQQGSYYQNASNLTSGTVPDSRIAGSYTGMTNLTGSGTVDFSKFYGNATDTVTAPSFSWTTDTNTGIYQPAADQLAITTGGAQRALFNSSGITGTLVGNASTATKLQTARTISLTGDSTGSGTFDGSGNLSIAVTRNTSNMLTDMLAVDGSGSGLDADLLDGIQASSFLRSDTSGSINGALTVNGGDIVLGGTGRIQGIDTVSASTDAANKAYVDAHRPRTLVASGVYNPGTINSGHVGWIKTGVLLGSPWKTARDLGRYSIDFGNNGGGVTAYQFRTVIRATLGIVGEMTSGTASDGGWTAGMLVAQVFVNTVNGSGYISGGIIWEVYYD